jgi:hypothetical protein
MMLQAGIKESDIAWVSYLLHPDKVRLLEDWYGNGIFPLIQKIWVLPKSQERYSFIDFDDTLNNRARQLQHPLLQDNRGDAGTFIAIELFRKRLSNAFRMYFWESAMSKELTELLCKTPSSILTATVAPGFQKEKMYVCFPYADKILTQKWIDKPKAIIDKIVRLGYIPKTIDIYDDRTNNFYGVQNSKRADNDMLLVSSLFPWTVFTLYYVEYAWKESEPTILRDRVWEDGRCTYRYPYFVRYAEKVKQRVNTGLIQAL